MPKVPSLQGATVDTAIAGSVGQARIPDFVSGSGDIGRAAARVAESLGRVVQRERKKADDLVVLEALSKSDDYQNTLLHGVDGQGGALSTRGKNGLEVHDPTIESWASKNDELSKGMATEEQRDSLSRALLGRKKGMSTSLRRHSARQGEVYRDEVSLSYIKGLQTSAVNNFADPERVGLEVDRQKEAIYKYAEDSGKSKGWAKDKAFDSGSVTHASVIDRMINSDLVREAEAYFKKNEKKLTPNHHKSVATVIERSLLRIESQEVSDKLFGKDISQTDALEEVNKIEDPELRKEARSKLKGRYSDRKQAELFDNRKKYESYADVLTKNNGKIEAIPDSELAKLSIAEEKDLNAYARQIRTGQFADRNSQEYYDLSNMAGDRSTRAKFKDINLMLPKHKIKIDPGQMSELIRLQRDLRSGKGDSDKLLDGVETKNAIVNGGLTEMGIKYGTGANTENNRRANLFRRKVDDQIVEAQVKLGRKVTNEEVRTIKDDMMVEATTDKGFFFDTKVRVFELDYQQDAEVQLEDIPDEAKIKIRDALRRNGRPVNDKSMLELYLKRLNRIK